MKGQSSKMNKLKHKELQRFWPLYIFQVSTYGKNYLDMDDECDLMRYRPMPCTPSGDRIQTFETVREAFNYLLSLEEDMKHAALQGTQLEALPEERVLRNIDNR